MIKKFRIIPVLDIFKSQAVHAIKGERDNYKPLNSKLFSSTDPYEIVKSLKFNYGAEELYIADLDSIIYKNPNHDLLEKISKISNLKIMIDPGIISMRDITYISQFKFNKVILGLETINSFHLIIDCIENVGANKIVVSIDMYDGKIKSKIRELKNLSLKQIVNKIQDLGVEEIILLDLYRVGQKMGDIPPIYLEVREIFKHTVLVGGGIKDSKDLMQYANYNFSGVLIATALYDGTINVDIIRNFSTNQ